MQILRFIKDTKLTGFAVNYDCDAGRKDCDDGQYGRKYQREVVVQGGVLARHFVLTQNIKGWIICSDIVRANL